MSKRVSYVDMATASTAVVTVTSKPNVVYAPAPTPTERERLALEALEERKKRIAEQSARKTRRPQKKKPRPQCNHCGKKSCGYIPAKCRYCEENICHFCIREKHSCSSTLCEICGGDFGSGDGRCRVRECWDCKEKTRFLCSDCFRDHRHCRCYVQQRWL